MNGFIPGNQNILQINSDKLKVVDNQFISPTYSLDLAKQVWHLIQTDNFGLYHAASLGQCSILEFAKYILKCLNREINLIPIKLSELDYPAPRPKYSALENKKLKDSGLNIMRPWQEAVLDYLKEKKYLLFGFFFF